VINRITQFTKGLTRRQWALIGGVAGIGLLVFGVAGAALLNGGGSGEELVSDPCASGSDELECEEPSSTSNRTPNFKTTAKASASATPTSTPKATATKAVTVPTKTPTKAPTPPPVTPPPTTSGPSPDVYFTAPLVSDTYLGSIGGVIEFAIMPGSANVAIVASQGGKIYKVTLDGSGSPQLWGDLSGKIVTGGEQGLLSVAFSPGFPGDGRVYVYYTKSGRNVLSRYSANATSLNNGSEQELVSINDFAANHNGGHIAFDSARYLYLSTGDGGGGGDPEENGQDLTSLLGKVLRLDVSGSGGYAIPPGNPFNDGGGPVKEEIFAYGFRNPWRMTIDPPTDQVWLGDVGQGVWEEVDQVVVGGNYGWDCFEGSHSYESAGCGSGFRNPRHEYDHSWGQAVTGGAIYRGNALPELRGWYVFSDFYSGHIWAVEAAGSGGSVHLGKVPYNVSSFTLLPDGELAVVSYDNGVYRLAR
jgi:glucose/arabinose dehydrogenase